MIIRNDNYEQLIAGFQRATVRERIAAGDQNAGWEFFVRPEGSQTTAWVRAGKWMTVVKVKYEDEHHERALYKYVDYSLPAEIKTAGSILYVHWVEQLLVTNHFILAYDITNRREISRRRVDPADLSGTGEADASGRDSSKRGVLVGFLCRSVRQTPSRRRADNG